MQDHQTIWNLITHSLGNFEQQKQNKMSNWLVNLLFWCTISCLKMTPKNHFVSPSRGVFLMWSEFNINSMYTFLLEFWHAVYIAYNTLHLFRIFDPLPLKFAYCLHLHWRFHTHMSHEVQESRKGIFPFSNFPIFNLKIAKLHTKCLSEKSKRHREKSISTIFG